jgi:predicted nicotinamide N-methyase
MDLVEEVIPLPGRELVVRRPRDSDALLDEEAFEQEERMPYWAELWPSGVALARAVWGSALRGKRVLELGCGGLALPSIAAALCGGRVVASDWAEEGLALAADNAARNQAAVETVLAAWGNPGVLVDRGPWDLVLGADVLYEQRNVGLLADLLPRLVAPSGAVWIADPGRPPLPAFLDAARERFTVAWSADAARPAEVYRLRLRPS